MRLTLKHFGTILSILFFANLLQAQTPEGYTWQEIKSVDFSDGANHFSIKAASAGSGGEVELRLDADNGQTIGHVYFHHTGTSFLYPDSSINFMDYECDLSQTVSGVHNVYMNFQDYTKPVNGGVLNIGEFQFSLLENEIELPPEGNFHVYPEVPDLDPSPYYTYQVQKVSKLNATNLENVTNWETPFAWFTKCPDADDPNAGKAYYRKFIASWSHTYCNFELDPNTPIVVKITRLEKEGAPSGPITAAVPHPARKVESCEIIDGDVYVTMSNPAQVAIDIDGQLDSRNAPRAIPDSWNNSKAFPYTNEKDGAHAVTIFANPFITDKPDPDGVGVKKVNPGDPIPEDDGTWTTLYFMPGIHNMSVDENGNEREWRPEDVYKINSNRQYYIPGDAIVYGNFNDKDPTGWFGKTFENIRLFGHGTISGAKRPHWDDWPEEYNEKNISHDLLRVFEVSDPRNVVVEGITSADQAEHGIYLIGYNRDDYSPNYIKWIKMIGWRVNTDGMVVYGNGYIEDCFLRLQDDAFYVNGMAIRRCVIWADVNGAPFRGDRFMSERGGDYMESELPKDLLVEDIDIIYTRGVFSKNGTVIGGGGNNGENTYSNGTNNTGQHLVFRGINIEDPLPQRTLLGTSERNLKGVRFEDINFQYPHTWGSIPSIKGEENAPLEYWVFDNVKIDGENVDADYLNNPEKFETSFIQDMTFRLCDTIHSTGHTLIRTATSGKIALDTISGASNEITLTATPIEGYEFDGWGGDLNGTENVATLIMDGDKEITANFSVISYSISATATNGTFTFDPPLDEWPIGSEVTVTAHGNIGWGFDAWEGDLSGTVNPITITMDSDKDISASFTSIETYNLNVTAQYGQVILDPPGGTYNNGIIVTLIPKSDTVYYFGEWGGELFGSTYPATITMDADKTVNARFFYAGNGSGTYAINCGGDAFNAADGTSYSKDNTSGGTYSTDEPISGTDDDALYQSEKYGEGISYNIPMENGMYEVTLMFAEIFQNAPNNRVFDVIIEDDVLISELDIFAEAGKFAAYNKKFKVAVVDKELNISFGKIVENPKISAIKVSPILAEIQPETYTLTLSSSANGSLTIDPEKDSYPAGSNVLVTALPDEHYMLTFWGGNLTGIENPSYIYMDGNKEITATFHQATLHTITVNAENGSVILSPESETYVYGTLVNASAQADDGYEFVEWKGDISGTTNPIEIAIDGDKEITAVFDKKVGLDELEYGVRNTYALKQNYPNPFSMETTIPFELSKLAQVQISVYNPIGQKVTQIVNQQFKAGKHGLVWHANDRKGNQISGGLYFYKMKINNQSTQTKKMIVVK
ncbi:MAG: malectin domain-containing carbohydrate-binding protein [Prolixibacteraceae bacterium]|nr:malectin domain-containing carbohydrate-binding protein [Prolixibacteraceae bacterium]